MPIAELEQLVLEKASNLQRMQAERRGPLSPETPSDMPSASIPAGGAIALPAELVRAATTALTQLGVMQAPVDVLMPQHVSQIQAMIDKTDPGLYNLSDPQQLKEVLNELANGLIGFNNGNAPGIGSGGFR